MKKLSLLLLLIISTNSYSFCISRDRNDLRNTHLIELSLDSTVNLKITELFYGSIHLDVKNAKVISSWDDHGGASGYVFLDSDGNRFSYDNWTRVLKTPEDVYFLNCTSKSLDRFVDEIVAKENIFPEREIISKNYFFNSNHIIIKIKTGPRGKYSSNYTIHYSLVEMKVTEITIFDGDPEY